MVSLTSGLYPTGAESILVVLFVASQVRSPSCQLQDTNGLKLKWLQGSSVLHSEGEHTPQYYSWASSLPRTRASGSCIA